MHVFQVSAGGAERIPNINECMLLHSLTRVAPGCVCACVCVHARARAHTHTCVCACMCMWVRARGGANLQHTKQQQQQQGRRLGVRKCVCSLAEGAECWRLAQWIGAM